MIIAIDGPAGSGKGYIAKHLALEYNLDFYATGEIVRLYAYLNEELSNNNENFTKQRIIDCFKNKSLQYIWDKQNVNSRILFNGQDITLKLYTKKASNDASIFMKLHSIDILDTIREIGNIILHNNNGFVIEGRQTTSLLFPNADFRFYLDASVEERARRRKIDFDKLNISTTIEEQIKELNTRDERDITREIGPLKLVEGVVYVDCTKLTKEEALQKFKTIIEDK